MLIPSIFISFLIPSKTLAQRPDSVNLDINNIKATFYSDGTLFWDKINQETHFEVPKNSGNHTLRASNLWIGAYYTSGKLHLAARTYGQYFGTDFWAGPIIDSSVSLPQNHWNKVYLISRKIINGHKKNWNKTGYQMPDVIKNWPGNGPDSSHKILAPFVDLNNNKIYEPEKGEFPDVKGDQTAYFIFNDVHGKHSESQGKQLGIEVYGLAFSFDAQPPLDKTIFVQLQVVNRSPKRYDSVMIGIWTDFDMGNEHDDFIGSDPSRNMYYGYNGDTFDEGSGGYGSNPPAQAVVFLNKPMDFIRAYDNSFSKDGNPERAIDYYWCMKSRLLNGEKVKTFAFSGDPCADTGNIDSGHKIDRKLIGSNGPNILNSGDTLALELAYVYAQSTKDNDSSNISSVCALKKAVDAVQKFYNGNLTNIQNGINDVSKGIKIFPNPAENNFNIQVKDNSSFGVKLHNISGKKLLSLKSTYSQKATVNVEELRPGIYLLEVDLSGGQRVFKKVILY